MNQAKAVFFIFLVLYNMVGLAHGLVHALFSGLESVAWYASIFSNLTMVVFFFVYLMRIQPARTSARLPWLLFTTSTCSLIILIDVFFSPVALGPFVYGVGAAGCGSYLYVYWYSNLDRVEFGILEEGLPLPDFQIERYDGRKYRSSDFVGRPALFLFYRGNWCPLCLSQISEIAEECVTFIDRGVSLILVSPQPSVEVQKLAVTNHPLMHFMVDIGGRAAKQLGIVHERGLPVGLEVVGYDADTVYPTIVITDADGKMVYIDKTNNFRVRPHVSELLNVLDRNDITRQSAEELLPLFDLA